MKKDARQILIWIYLDFEIASSAGRAPCDSAMSTTSMYTCIPVYMCMYVGVGCQITLRLIGCGFITFETKESIYASKGAQVT